MGDLERILKGRLPPSDYSKFQVHRSRRGREIHRVVLLRNAEIAFAYLLPGGPPTIQNIGKGKWKRKKSFPSLSKVLPLSTSRLDPNWTAGRDQHPEVDQRQAKHVLVLGAGALGSSIVAHLAKAGVGRISLVDADTMSPPNVGRHLLGAESIGENKAWAVAKRVNLAFPSTEVAPYFKNTAAWLKENSLAEVHAVLDLTGEPDVRMQIENARQKQPCPLLIGWMEPYVAAAHACFLPSGQSWLQGAIDPLYSLQAVEWPDEVIQQEPGCSSRFQSYTAAAAEHAVALIAECVLEMIDASVESILPKVRSWVRGQLYLDEHWPGLKHNEWASIASEFEGLILTRPFP
ncbi:ThiF family adenylyltransferase [Raoultella ornithinolytica]|nr:thiamine biosynthesis protein ThiF [Klebsiella oxytoca]POT85810.1 thiamine biosynthesis protein ThiF [Klebsiella oxytoca]POV48485.1 thiamine biosynthesis protein ThiF [Klebsiella oxytoca]RWS96528.1 ThiF family adenylyltransferase [Raoultella ornithinolytica]